MAWIKKTIEAIKGNEDLSDIKSSSIRDILDGNILTKNFLKKQYLLLIMIAVLAFWYVDNIFYCQKQLIREIELKKQIQDVKYESLTISAQLMEVNRQSNILKMVKERGLNLIVTETPPIVIEVEKSDIEPNK